MTEHSVEPVRAWTVTSDERFLSGGVTLAGPAEIHSGTTVLEAEPILDLLESWLAIDARARSPLTEQTESILRANGRTP